MIELALQNGISRKLYRSRIKGGWDEKKAATKPLQCYKGEYAVYKGGEIIAMGTREECAKELGVSAHYIHWMTTPTGKKRLAARKDPETATAAVKLDE